jgi:DDE superfamily endonuclease
LTVVACVGANGIAVPPLIVVPGQHLSRDMMDGCDIPGGSVTVEPKGFMNACLFEKWLRHFDSAVPETIKRPLILVYDDYSSHFNEDIATKVISLNIILALLPSNATHLLQSLDIAVFKPFKTIMKRVFDQSMIENAIVSISKKEAIEVSSIALTEGIQAKKKNILSGFEASGIWPLNFKAMQARLKLFQDGGVDLTKVEAAPWITSCKIIHR